MAATGLIDVDTLQVLLVEDNAGDVQLIQDAVAFTKAPVDVHVAENAVQAFWFLDQRGAFAGVPRADVVVLDLHLPVIDGQQVLELMKATPAWSDIPTIILTSSSLMSDCTASARHGAVAFQTKPLTWEGYVRLVDRFLACARSGFAGSIG
jgi:CheY-like chemotaxis protein